MRFFRIAAALCFLAVALGAFGAHFLHSRLVADGRVETWNTAVLYHLAHAIALLALVLHRANRGACYLLAAGILFFSGSLYLFALTNISWLVAITPVGGVCFLAGWVWLAVAPPR